MLPFRMLQWLLTKFPYIGLAKILVLFDVIDQLSFSIPEYGDILSGQQLPFSRLD
jgi:hypothetical protein